MLYPHLLMLGSHCRFQTRGDFHPQRSEDQTEWLLLVQPQKAQSWAEALPGVQQQLHPQLQMILLQALWSSCLSCEEEQVAWKNR